MKKPSKKAKLNISKVTVSDLAVVQGGGGGISYTRFTCTGCN